GGEGFDPHLALQALGASNLAQKHPVRFCRQGYSAAGCSPSGTASGGGAGAAAASPAALAFSPAAATFPPPPPPPLLPGCPLFGFERASRSAMPALSRKRSTRSVGWAPCPSQCLMRSSMSLTRSAESRGSSGL